LTQAVHGAQEPTTIPGGRSVGSRRADAGAAGSRLPRLQGGGSSPPSYPWQEEDGSDDDKERHHSDADPRAHGACEGGRRGGGGASRHIEPGPCDRKRSEGVRDLKE